MSAFIVKPNQIAVISNHAVKSGLFKNWLNYVKVALIEEGAVLEHEKQFVEQILNLAEDAPLSEKAELLSKVLAHANYESVYYNLPAEYDDERINLDKYIENIQKAYNQIGDVELSHEQFQMYASSLNYQSCDRNDWDMSIAKELFSLALIGFKIELPQYYGLEWAM